MRIVSANCDRCGAPLEIPIKAKRVTCLYCDTALEVVRTASVVTTAVLEQLDQRMGEVETEVERMKLRDRLRSIDDNWLRFRERYLGPDGKGGVPTRGSAQAVIIFSITLIVIGILMAMTGSLFGFGVSALGVILFITGLIAHASARTFEGHRRSYQRRRRVVLKELRLLREDAPA